MKFDAKLESYVHMYQVTNGTVKTSAAKLFAEKFFQDMRQEFFFQIDHKCIRLYLNIKNILRSYIYKISTQGNVLAEMKRCEFRDILV